MALIPMLAAVFLLREDAGDAAVAQGGGIA